MDFYMQANAAESAPKLSTLTEKGHFTSGSPELAIPPSTPGAAWFESVTAEIVNAIEKLGGTPSRDNIDQLADTLLAKFALKADLESPVLTGDVTVPDPVQDHNPVTKAYLVDLLKRMSNVPTGAVLTIAGDKVPEGFYYVTVLHYHVQHTQIYLPLLVLFTVKVTASMPHQNSVQLF